jgi:hypothetical protein
MAALLKRRHAEGAGIGGLNATVTVRPTRRLLDAICASVDDSRFIIPTGLVGSAVARIEPTGRAKARPMTGSAKSGAAERCGRISPGFHSVQFALRGFRHCSRCGTPTPDPSPQGGGEKACFRFTEIAFDSRPKSPAYCRHPVPQEGRFANVTDVGAGRGGRGSFRRASADV